MTDQQQQPPPDRIWIASDQVDQLFSDGEGTVTLVPTWMTNAEYVRADLVEALFDLMGVDQGQWKFKAFDRDWSKLQTVLQKLKPIHSKDTDIQ